MLNSFDYGCEDSISASAFDLCNAFAATIPDLWTILVNEGVLLVSVSGSGLFGATDLGFAAINAAGEVTGDALPPYAAFSFVFTKANTDSPRRGLRIGVPSESDQVDGTLSSGPLANMAALADALGQVLTGTDDDLYTPIVVRTRLNGSPVSPPEFWIPGTVALASVPLSTQTSRKFGHGI
jgi:hypothetical protein